MPGRQLAGPCGPGPAVLIDVGGVAARSLGLAGQQHVTGAGTIAAIDAFLSRGPAR